MAQLQHIQQQMGVQHTAVPVSTAVPTTYNSCIPYHIYQNVVLAALNGSNPDKHHQQAMAAVLCDQIKTEDQPQPQPQPPHPQPQPHPHPQLHELGPDLKSSPFQAIPPVVSGNDLIQLSNLKSVFTVSSANSQLLTPTNQIMHAQPAHLETLQAAPINPDPSPLQPLPQHVQPVSTQQQQLILPFNLSLPNNQPNSILDQIHHQQTPPQQQQQVTTQIAQPGAHEQVSKKKRKNKNVSEKVHVCSECNYTCNRADKLRVHVKGVHGNDKPFPCNYCGKNFKQRDKVSRHVNTVHYRERPYACDYCPLAFGRKDKVKRHVSTVHLGERPYRCNYCSHNTTRRDKMRIHLQQVHQSVDGSEHYIIERAPQPPPRVLAANTHRNVSDLAPPLSATTTASQPVNDSDPLDVKPNILGVPDGIQVTPTSVTTTLGPQGQEMVLPAPQADNLESLVSLAPVSVVPSLVTSGQMNLSNQMMIGEENSQNAINNVVPVRIVTKL